MRSAPEPLRLTQPRALQLPKVGPGIWRAVASKGGDGPPAGGKGSAAGGEGPPAGQEGSAPQADGRLPGVRSPLEAHSSYRGEDWSPERLVFHQNLESFAERVGLIVGLQSNGKLSQDKAYAEIRKLWKSLRASKGSLFNEQQQDGDG